MMAGYAIDHAEDVYKMYDPIGNEIYLTRDVKWHKRMYFKDRAGQVTDLNEYPITTLEERTTAVQQPAASTNVGTDPGEPEQDGDDEPTGTRSDDAR